MRNLAVAVAAVPASIELQKRLETVGVIAAIRRDHPASKQLGNLCSVIVIEVYPEEPFLGSRVRPGSGLAPTRQVDPVVNRIVETRGVDAVGVQVEDQRADLARFAPSVAACAASACLWRRGALCRAI